VLFPYLERGKREKRKGKQEKGQNYSEQPQKEETTNQPSLPRTI
jgi:hypothetical protein